MAEEWNGFQYKPGGEEGVVKYLTTRMSRLEKELTDSYGIINRLNRKLEIAEMANHESWERKCAKLEKELFEMKLKMYS
jgi:hypothetical protein